MPRLTNYIYLERHRFLEAAWRDFKPIFSIIPASDQLNLHLYYQTWTTATDEEMLFYRHYLASEHPSLPNSASKSFHTIYRAFRKAFEYAQGDERRFMAAVSALTEPKAKVQSVESVSNQPDRVISVRGLVSQDVDVERLARALLVLAEELEDKDSAA